MTVPQTYKGKLYAESFVLHAERFAVYPVRVAFDFKGHSPEFGRFETSGVAQMTSPHRSVRRERRVLSVGEIPTRQLSFQPVAIGTVVEVTKRLKLPV